MQLIALNKFINEVPNDRLDLTSFAKMITYIQWNVIIMVNYLRRYLSPCPVGFRTVSEHLHIQPFYITERPTLTVTSLFALKKLERFQSTTRMKKWLKTTSLQIRRRFLWAGNSKTGLGYQKICVWTLSSYWSFISGSILCQHKIGISRQFKTQPFMSSNVVIQ